MRFLDRYYSVKYLLITQLFYKIYLGSVGRKSRIISPIKIQGGKNIRIGNFVTIERFGWIASLPLTGDLRPDLTFEDGVIVGHFAHIFCTNSISIRKNALIADKVYISDNTHAFSNPETPIRFQPVTYLNKIEIGEGCWIGENVCIIGASVGKGSVIGANSVVTQSIPDYCVAVGSPARVIKRYSWEKKLWLRTDQFGNFI